MKHNQLETYFTKVLNSRSDYSKLHDIAASYGGTITTRKLINRPFHVVAAFFTGLGYVPAPTDSSLFVRSTEGGWSCFELTQIDRLKATIIRGVGQDSEIPEISVIPGYGESPVIRSAVDLVICSTNNLPLPDNWTQKTFRNVTIAEIKDAIRLITNDAMLEEFEHKHLENRYIRGTGHLKLGFVLVESNMATEDAGYTTLQILTDENNHNAESITRAIIEAIENV